MNPVREEKEREWENKAMKRKKIPDKEMEEKPR